ncbi:MAG: hypothetical protein ACRDNI_10350 [Gaiellaceae bacterium]
MRPTRIALLVALLAALVAAGCGSSAEGVEETTSTEREAAPIGAEQLVAQFRQASGGTQLRGAPIPDTAWEQLGLGQNPTPRQQRQYGTFTVYVVEASNDEAVTSLLSDKDTAKPLTQDADGIYWDFDELADSYVAHKRYGQNVVLAWWNEKPEPGTDARFERLDALMEEATSG